MAKKNYCEIKYCEICGGVYGKHTSSNVWKKRKYCSVECKKSWKKYNYTEIKWCECCNKVFPRNRKHSQKQWDEIKYCGRECQQANIWNRGLTLDDEKLEKATRQLRKYSFKKNNKPWSKGLTKETDERLAKLSITISEIQKRNPRKANENQLVGLELGRMWCKGLTKEDHPSIARRAKILSEKYTGVKRPEQSERQRQYFQDNPEKHPNAILAKKTKGNGYTHIEKIVSELLQELGIEAVFNHKVGSKWPDFAVIEKRKIIECDGERWHKDKKKEQERDLYLAQCGWDVLHLTGSEIVSKTSECKERIFEFVGSSYDNYSSIDLY
jgi:very-short-patch-repair endonuclease